MRIALTHNLRLSDSEEEAEFDTGETVDALAVGDRAAGPPGGADRGLRARLADRGARSRRSAPDLIFNTAEGRRGRFREAFFPALFDELGMPYTGSDAYALARHARQAADQARARAARRRDPALAVSSSDLPRARQIERARATR